MAEYIVRTLPYTEVVKLLRETIEKQNNTHTIIDVSVLPTKNIDTNAFYRVTTEENEVKLYTVMNDEFVEIPTEKTLAPVATSGKFEDLTFEWDTEFIFDGGDADVPLAKLDTTQLS